ncbi:MAG: diacylglycerol/lipid kinase family protein, partial [Gemmatimonadales bacterium]
AILRGRPLTVDLGVVEREDGPHYFAVAAGTGFDAELMAETAAAAKRRWKMGAYVARALTTLHRVRTAPHRVIVDGQAHDVSAAMVLVANCGELFPPFLRLRQGIAPDDGWLDVVALRATGAVESVAAFWDLLRGVGGAGNDGAQGRVWFARGRTVRVEVAAPAPRPVQLDGEPTGTTPFEARLVPGALTVLVEGPRP